MTETTLIIPKIENGIVIDHVPVGRGAALLHVLLAALGPDTKIALGVNLPSSRLGKKDLVKIWDMDLPPVVLAHISLVAPGATIKRIRDFTVEEKVTVVLPETMDNLLRCPNPGCITNVEPGLRTRFASLGAGSVRCAYCERPFALDQLERII